MSQQKFLFGLLAFATLFFCTFGGWVSLSPIPTRRSDHSCDLIGNIVYLGGGCASDEVYEANSSACSIVTDQFHAYNLLTDTWVAKASLPRVRNRHVSIHNDQLQKIYYFGGRDQEDNIVKYVDVYDIVSDKWSTLSNLFENATSDLTGYLNGDLVVLVGGYDADYNPIGATHYYYPLNNTFSYYVSHLTKPRGDICAGIAGNNLYSFGGYQTDFCHPTSFLEEYNFQTRTWSLITTKSPGVTGGDGACASLNNQFYILGGEEKNITGDICYSDPTSVVTSYDPSTDYWDYDVQMNLPSGRFRYCSVGYNNTLYVFGGQGPLQEKYGQKTHSILADSQVFMQTSSASLTLVSSVVGTFTALFLALFMF